jgi:glucokinase
MLLSGDIGGTKTVLAVFSEELGPTAPAQQKSYPSVQYASLEDIIRAYLADVREPIENACFAVAGPVADGRVRTTNLPWLIDAEEICTAFSWQRMDLLNDLEAVAYAIPILAPADTFSLSAGSPVAGGSIAVIAPGTGLGEAYLAFANGGYTAYASEGRHASFAPLDSVQMGLLTFMLEKKGFDHVSFERVCSGGLGIPNLYAYFKETGLAEEPAWLAQELAACDDPTPVIVNNALDASRACELCTRTLDLFVEILGAEAGNLALKIMASGGIYLGGGISPRILPRLQQPAFLEALRGKGRFRELLSAFPVRVILNPMAGLLGTAAFGFDQRARANL